MNNALTNLYFSIIQTHNLEELRTLCFLIGIRYDDLGGEGIEAKTRELILKLGRRKSLNILIEALKSSRPELFSQEINQTYLKELYSGLPNFQHGDYKSPQNPILPTKQPAKEPNQFQAIRSHTVFNEEIHTNETTNNNKKKALIIEDIPSQQQAIWQVVDELGVAVTVANDFESALKFIRANTYDLITLDMQLDEMDESGQAGITLLDQMRTYQRDAAVIIISALPWTGKNVRDFLREYGAFDYFVKPFNPNDLKKRVEEAIF